MSYGKTCDPKWQKSFGSWDIRTTSVEWGVDAMSDSEVCAGSSSSNSCICCCSINEEAESYCQCESDTPDTNVKELGKYWNSNEQLYNGEEIITAAFDLHLASSDSEDSLKQFGSNNGQTDSVTEVTDDTSPSQLTIITSDYEKPCFSSYFTPEKYTRTKVTTFRKTGDRTFKMEASSAINRRKKQFEIDRQNMIILKKLREVKPVVVLPK